MNYRINLRDLNSVRTFCMMNNIPLRMKALGTKWATIELTEEERTTLTNAHYWSEPDV